MAVNIYEYTDYRKFLGDWLAERRNSKRTMSLRHFARAAGISASNYLTLVIQGKRNLMIETARKFKRAMKLKKREAAFFEALVEFDQAADSEEKAAVYERLMAFRRFHAIHRMEDDAYRLLSKWYIAAVHELAAFPDFESRPAWIASKLKPRISLAEAGQAVEVLMRLGLIRLDPETGKARQTKGSCATPDVIAGPAVYNLQKEMLTLAHDALRFLPNSVRDISGLTIAVSKGQFEKARQMIREFRRDLHAALSTGEKAEAVYQINFQIFPLSEVANG